MNNSTSRSETASCGRLRRLAAGIRPVQDFVTLPLHTPLLTPEGAPDPSQEPSHARRILRPGVHPDDGVVTAPVANGAQVLHLSVALCVLNDTYREASRLGIQVDGVVVEADGGFDEEWRSTGVEYLVILDSRASTEDLARLDAVVDEVAEIPRAIRAGALVSRRG